MIRPDRDTRILARNWGAGDLRFLTQTATATLWRSAAGDLVLKVFNEVGRRDEASGTHWLKWADGSGAVRLRNANETAQLLDFCGDRNAVGLTDHAALLAMCSVISRFPAKAPPNGLVPLNERLRVLVDTSEDANPHVELANRIWVKLRTTAGRPAALHGDIHHENVLFNGQDWVVIDPKGVLGDPAYDVANLFLNPVSHPAVVQDADRARRVQRTVAEALDLCPHRVMCFAFVHATTAALWAEQDGQDPRFALTMADVLSPLAQEASDALFP